MDTSTRTIYDNLSSEDGTTRSEALSRILEVTEKRVDWAYEVWDELLARLRDRSNHRRAIAAQLLCNLAKSDSKNRMVEDFDAVMAVTRDEKFVTARHCLQSTWKVAAAGKKLQGIVLDRLADRFRDSSAEKNCTLIRFDIIQGLRRLYDVADDQTVKALAMKLIETEDDVKYRKKYAGLWKDT